MESWGFLTNHARVLLCIAHDPGVRLRDIAASLGITERSAYGIVTDLTAAGYVIKHRDGRRNRYQIQAHMPLPEPASQEPAIGEVLALLIGNRARSPPKNPNTLPPTSVKWKWATVNMSPWKIVSVPGLVRRGPGRGG